MLQSLGLGPKMDAAAGLERCGCSPRALPVPFCLNGLRPPPRTSLFVSVDAVPRRAFCRTITTYLCTRPFATSGLATLRSSVAEPAEAPSKLTFATSAARTETSRARAGAAATARKEGRRERGETVRSEGGTRERVGVDARRRRPGRKRKRPVLLGVDKGRRDGRRKRRAVDAAPFARHATPPTARDRAWTRGRDGARRMPPRGASGRRVVRVAGRDPARLAAITRP